MIGHKTNTLPKQYAEVQLLSGFSLYTRKPVQFFTSILKALEHSSENPTRHAVKFCMIPSGGVGSKQ